MRFHCPQCDTKYRIAEDKLAAKPTAKMRCKECATVFSLQEAIAAAALRTSELSAPGTESELHGPLAAVILPSAPPPRVPLPARPSRPPGASQPGALARSALQTRPLTSRASDRPLASPGASSPAARAVGAPTRPLGSPATLPLPRPTPANLAGGSSRGGYSAPLGEARGLTSNTPMAPTHERLSPTASVGPAPREGNFETPSAGSVAPASADRSGAPAGPVLGRGSAAGFPPVTAERTLPAVPPFHQRSPAMPSALGPSSSRHRTSSPPNPGLTRPASESTLPPEEAGTSSAPEYEGNPTPRFDQLNVETEVPDPFSSGPWSSNVNALVSHGAAPETRESVAASREGGVGSVPPDTTGVRVETGTASSVDVASTKFVLAESETNRRKGGVSMVVAVMVAGMFGAGGFGFGYVMGASQVSAERPVAPAPAVQADARGVVTPPPPPPPPEGSAGETVVDLPEGSGAPGRPVETRARKSTDRASEGTPNSASGDGDKPSDSLSGLAAGVGPAPVAGPGSERGTATGLEAAAIQSTVQKNQNAVKRSCWQPALNGRSADAPSTARVTTTIQIAPNGAVASVKHSGDPRGYPGLGSCIVTRVKTWTFPRANGSTTANIPFVFAAQ